MKRRSTARLWIDAISRCSKEGIQHLIERHHNPPGGPVPVTPRPGCITAQEARFQCVQLPPAPESLGIAGDLDLLAGRYPEIQTHRVSTQQCTVELSFSSDGCLGLARHEREIARSPHPVYVRYAPMRREQPFG